MGNNNPQNASYKVILSEKGGKVLLHVKELGILASGDDIKSAYDDLSRKKAEVFAEFEEAGLTEELPRPGASDNGGYGADNKRFVFKTVIVAAAALVVVFGATLGARSVVDKGVQSLSFRVGNVHLKLIENKIVEALHRAADPRNEFSAEKKEKIVSDLRAIVKRYKPFVDEVRPLVTGGGTSAGN